MLVITRGYPSNWSDAVNKCPGECRACASASNNISTGFTGEEINDCVTSDGIDPTSKTERALWAKSQGHLQVSSGCPSKGYPAMWMKSWIMSLHIEYAYPDIISSSCHILSPDICFAGVKTKAFIMEGCNGYQPGATIAMEIDQPRGPRASRLAVAHVSNPMKSWPRIDALNQLRSGLAWISHLFGIWLGPNCWLSQKLSKIVDLILGYLGSIPNIHPQKLVIVIIPPSVVNASKHVKPHEWARQVGRKESLSQFVSIPSGYLT